MEWILILIMSLLVVLFWCALKKKFGDPDQVNDSFYSETFFDKKDDK